MDLEKCISTQQLKICEEKIGYLLLDTDFTVSTTKKLTTISDYRREFNTEYCTKSDVLMWGESDALIPTQTFNILHDLHNASLGNNNPKYLAFFGTCKMWDDTWLQLEHPDFTDKPFFDKPEQFKPDHWWSLRYTMSQEEMNQINSKVEDLDLKICL